MEKSPAEAKARRRRPAAVPTPALQSTGHINRARLSYHVRQSSNSSNSSNSFNSSNS